MEKTNDFFKFPAGDTKLRVMTQPVEVRQYWDDQNKKYVMVDKDYKGTIKPSLTGWAWCVVRGQGLKIVQIPYAVIKEVNKLMVNDEYQFDGFPMPYDLTVHNTGEGPARYSVTPARQNTEVTEEEKEEVSKKTPIADIIRRIREKAGLPPQKEVMEYPEGPDPDDVPF